MRLAHIIGELDLNSVCMIVSVQVEPIRCLLAVINHSVLDTSIDILSCDCSVPLPWGHGAWVTIPCSASR